jgi:hypothetical protein
MKPIRAVTLWPEWAWAISALDKRVENREWHPGWKLPAGSRIAIHAGKHIGGRAGRYALEEGLDGVQIMYQRAHGVVMSDEAGLIACPKSAIVCVATIAGYDQDERTGWDVPDAWHWRLSDVRALPEPIPCKGALGLWMPDDGIQRKLAEVLGG